MLQEARGRLQRFNSNPQRFVQQRRQELTQQMDQLSKQAACRQRLGLPPLNDPSPSNKKSSRKPLSPSTPTYSGTHTALLSNLHHRRPHSLM